MPLSNLVGGYLAEEWLEHSIERRPIRGPPVIELPKSYFLLAAFFLLKPVSTDAPMLASMSLAG